MPCPFFDPGVWESFRKAQFQRMTALRLSIFVFTAVAVALAPAGSQAGTIREPGTGFLEHKHPKVQKDYYVVYKRESDKCSIVIGWWGDAPAGALGGCPVCK